MDDFASLQQEFLSTRERYLKLQGDFEDARSSHLLSLPQQYGFEDVDSLIMALAPHASDAIKSKIALLSPSQSSSEPKLNNGKARIDNKKRDKIISTIKAGQLTAAAIARDFKVSVATINLIKSKEGLTKKRK
jgi:hypothetical protein